METDGGSFATKNRYIVLVFERVPYFLVQFQDKIEKFK